MPCHIFMTDSSSIMTYCIHCICHLMPSLFHPMGVALYCNFFLPSVFLLQLVFYLIKVCCLPSFCMGSTSRPSIFKCLLNNVGLIKAQSSILLALSRYVLIIKHVSVSTRLLPAFVTDLITYAVFIEVALCCRHVGWKGTTSQYASVEQTTECFKNIKYRKQFIIIPLFVTAHFELSYSDVSKMRPQTLWLHKIFYCVFKVNSILITEGSLIDWWGLKLIKRMDDTVNLSWLKSPLNNGVIEGKQVIKVWFSIPREETKLGDVIRQN